MDIGYWIQLMSLYAIPAVLAITLHEAAHGYAAKQLGDLTAYQAGRYYVKPNEAYRRGWNVDSACCSFVGKWRQNGVWMG